jgi:hypothetical protein
MITIIPIEPLSDAHGALIVESFNKLFIDRGGKADGDGSGYGDGWHEGNGYGYGSGDCWGDGRGAGYGDPRGDGGKCPEEWQAD